MMESELEVWCQYKRPMGLLLLHGITIVSLSLVLFARTSIPAF